MTESDNNSPELTDGDHEKNVRERLLDSIHTLSKPTKVSTIAEMADCSDQGARNILRQFEDLGIIKKDADSPVQYKKNESYFQFRRGHKLAQSHSDEELRAEIFDRWKKHQEWKREFDTEHPSTITVEQLHQERGEEAVDELHKWSATYNALKDHIEGLEQLRGTKLNLDISSPQLRCSPLVQPFIPVLGLYSDFIGELNNPGSSGRGQRSAIEEVTRVESNVVQNLNDFHLQYDPREPLLDQRNQTQTDIGEFIDRNESKEQ